MKFKAIVGLGLIVSSLFVGVKETRAECARYITNVEEFANVRSRPSWNSPTIGKAYRGEQLTVIGQAGPWYKVKLPQPGWIYRDLTSWQCGSIPQLNSQIEVDTTSYDYYIRVANSSYREGDYQTALINYRRALDERPGDNYARKAILATQRSIANRGY